MTTTYEFAWELRIKDGDQTRTKIGDRHTFESISPTLGVLYDTTDVIPDDTTSEGLWASGDGGVDSFEYLVFMSDVDVYIELANTATATDERLLLFVKGGVPLVIPSGVMGGFASDTSRLDSAALVEDTDYGDITAISVQNDAADGVGDATVRLILLG